METVKKDHFSEVTGKIIAQLEAGTVPWHQPWGFVEPAQNHFTGHRYRGINSLLMLLGNFSTPYFGTMKQINEAGGRVKKGTKAMSVYYHDVIYKANGVKISEEEGRRRSKAGDKTVSRIAFIRLFPVFNMADVEGCPVKPSVRRDNVDNQEIAVCQDFLTALNLGNGLRHADDDGAFFNKKHDFIQMPHIQTFETSELYYGTLFHELTHWTGHPDRLDRKTLTQAMRYGDTNYSLEELTAELGSCFLCNAHGISTPAVEQNAASYIEGWLSVLRKNSRFIWDAAGDAQAAYTFLMERATAL